MPDRVAVGGVKPVTVEARPKADATAAAAGDGMTGAVRCG